MKYVLFAALCFGATISHAAEDLAVLPSAPGPQAPGAMLETWLKQQAYVAFDRRRDAYEKIKTPADIITYPILHQLSRPTRWAEWMAEAGVKLDGPLRGDSYEQFAMIAVQ